MKKKKRNPKGKKKKTRAALSHFIHRGELDEKGGGKKPVTIASPVGAMLYCMHPFAGAHRGLFQY